jgi:glycosyltransferase involved in cell wall biosynthesis
MNVCIVVVTHNRLEYTRKAIARLLEDPNEQFDLYLWDNASTDGTPEYLKDVVKDPRIVEVVLSKENVGQTGAMNYVWSKTKTELVGKLDNDCLVTPGWTRILAQAHKDIDMLGTVACWHFPLKYFDEKRAAKKICTFNGHKIFVHPQTCGSGFIIKKKTFEFLGLWNKGAATGTTGYFYKMAFAGYINGWYYPLILQEHMDYLDSEHSRFHRYSFDEAYRDGYGYKFANIRNMEAYISRHKEIIDILMDGPTDPRYYLGWRIKYRRLLGRFRNLFNCLRDL